MCQLQEYHGYEARDPGQGDVGCIVKRLIPYLDRRPGPRQCQPCDTLYVLRRVDPADAYSVTACQSSDGGHG